MSSPPKPPIVSATHACACPASAPCAAFPATFGTPAPRLAPVMRAVFPSSVGTRSIPGAFPAGQGVRRGLAPRRAVASGLVNHLADETSPYLRQHADHPVEWFPS